MRARIDGVKVAHIGVTRGRAWVRRLPLLAVMLSGCTCGSGTPGPPAATPTRQAPPTAARASNLPAAAPATAPSGGPAAAAPAAADPARRATCESYVAVLSGKQTDAALLASAEVQWLAQQAPDLATCGAVASDSADVCKPISKWRPCPTCEEIGTQGRKPDVRTDDCYTVWSIMHELETSPNGRAFMLDECLTPDKDAADLCNGLIQGLRSGNCSAAGSAAPLCQAMTSLDAAQCVAMPGLPEDLPTQCKSRIASRGFLAKGLTALADAGGPKEAAVVEEWGDSDRLQRHAAAALGRPGACDAFAAAAVQVCVEKQMAVFPPTLPPQGEPTPLPTHEGSPPPQPQTS